MPGQPGQHGKNCARQHRERCEREGLRPWQVAQAIHRCCSVTLLKAHRLAREWTLDHVAEQGRNICVEQGLGQPSLSAQRLSHWESGREAPSPKYLDLLCQIYRTRPDRLGFGHDYSDEEAGTPAATSTEIALPTRPESDVAPLRSAEPTPWVGGGGKRPDSGEEAEEEMRRRAMLQGILLGAGVSLSGPMVEAIDSVRRQADRVLDASTVSATTIDHWEETAHQYASAYMRVAPVRLLRDVVADFADVQQFAQARQPLEYQKRLCYITGQLAGITGVLLIDLGDFRQARAWFHTARLAADETGDRWLRSWVRAEEAGVPYYYGQPLEAIRVAREARSVARDLPCSGGVMGAAMEARALARIGNTAAARQALKVAEGIFERLPRQDREPGAFGFPEQRLRIYASSVFTQTGDVKEARSQQDRGLNLVKQSRIPTPRSLLNFDKAHTLVTSNELVEAATVATSAVFDLPVEHRTDIVINRAREVAHSVPENRRQIPQVKAFMDMLDQVKSTRNLA
jgi:hypothetical protein